MPTELTGFKENGLDIADKYVSASDASLIRDDLTQAGIEKYLNYGGLWWTGKTSLGQAGNGTITPNVSSPIKVGSDEDWQFNTNHYITYAMINLKTDGTLWAWGQNTTYGGLGLGDLIHRSIPTQVGTDTDWVQISVAGNSSNAIKSDGTLWGWGRSWKGELGRGSTASISTPVQCGSDTDWSYVCKGSNTLFLIKTDGTMWSCGYNDFGQLGQSPKLASSVLTPVQVGVDTDWAVVTGNYDTPMALKTDGSLWVWGYNRSNQLGNGSTNTDERVSTPVMMGTSTDWDKIFSNQGGMFALKKDGSLWCWGYNVFGQLGLGDTINRSSPVQVGALTDWHDLSCATHIMAIKRDGSLWGWGYNFHAPIGLGDTVDRSSPVQVGALTNWIKVVAGGQHSHMTYFDPNE